ncbi:MAG: glycosyltransferase [Rhodobacteraceae bacterium]|nr:MAG: glycosyltransferase [Paracoccaceae bacterium]
MVSFDVVVIGRNEGLRLGAALRAAKGLARRVIYVDSGSRDDSVTQARALGITVCALDPVRPFTAARARNEGFAALGPDRAEFVHFVDGDCILQPDWPAQALDFMREHPQAGLVFGRQFEARPDASVYNFLTDWEWDKPAGRDALSAGCVLVRTTAMVELGGYDEALIAGEDDDFCLRLQAAGWETWRIGGAMTEHDARLLSFAPWWRRMLRAGYSYGALGQRHAQKGRAQRVRALVWGGVVPLLGLIGLVFWLPLFLLMALAIALSLTRQTRRFMRMELDPDRAFRAASVLMLGKHAELQGLVRFWRDQRAGRVSGLIEYK